jgi:putative membrane protein
LAAHRDPAMSQPAKRAVERLTAAAAEVDESADRRTILAADRTIFAAERAYAAWVRTGLAALAAGVGAKAALGQVMAESVVLAAGSVLVLFSAFCFAAAVWREISPGANRLVPTCAGSRPCSSSPSTAFL